jgi:glycerol-3-phosphate dehydrogenase
MTRLKPEVLIIGGGITGAGLARDLALRGIDCLLAERRDFNAGASGANHGLLHSGARYAVSDGESAAQCQQETELLKRLAPQCIEDTGGLFVALPEDDERYVADFAQNCALCGIPAWELDLKEVHEQEPALSERVVAAYAVNDATVDPFQLTLANLAAAADSGATVWLHHQVLALHRSRGSIDRVTLGDAAGHETILEPVQVVNAAGAWAAEVAALAGVTIPMVYSKGSLVITDDRLTTRVINRLRPATDGDILVPGGTVSIVGTTSIRIEALDDVRPTIDEIERIITTAADAVPPLANARYIRAYAGVRPLIGSLDGDDDRAISRGYLLRDHSADGISNFTSISGGKLTTYRLMAEKTADLVCRKLGRERPCETNTRPLEVDAESFWTEPGRAPRQWLQAHDPADLLLCECEMVPQSVIDRIVSGQLRQHHPVTLRAIGQRSRIGKGTCQGAFCAVRIAAYLYERGLKEGDQGLADIRGFLRQRWKGIRPVLWGPSLAQEELQEAMHCGLFNLER